MTLNVPVIGTSLKIKCDVDTSFKHFSSFFLFLFFSVNRVKVSVPGVHCGTHQQLSFAPSPFV